MKVGNIQIGTPYYVKNVGKKDETGECLIERGLCFFSYLKKDFTKDSPSVYCGYIVNFISHNTHIITSESKTLKDFMDELSNEWPDAQYSLAKFDENDPNPEDIVEPEILEAYKAVYKRKVIL